MHSRWILLIAAGLLCAACGPISKLPALPSADVEAERRKQEIDQIRDYFARLGRLDNVAFRLRAANRDDCKDWAWAQIGLNAGTVASLPHEYRSFSHEALSVGWTQATVLSVAETSPAAVAGIKAGDRLLTFNNEPVPRSHVAGWIGGFVRNNGVKPIQIMVRREGADEIHSVTPVVACAIPIELKSDTSPNAFTDGDQIVVHSSILQVARTDAQLALIIGHEMAHANLGHLRKRRTNMMIGWAGGAAIDVGIALGGVPTRGVFSKEFARAGAQAFSVDFEREADYVGAYYAARAGYDLAGTENIWRAMSLEDPGSLRIARDHPITPVRFVQMQKVAAEIADKQTRHMPLVPELRLIQEDAAPTSDEIIH